MIYKYIYRYISANLWMTSCMKLSYAATACPTLDKNAMPH